MVTPKNWLPQKNDQKKLATPPKKCYPKKMFKKKMETWKKMTYFIAGLLLNFGKMAYFILYGFINAIQTLYV